MVRRIGSRLVFRVRPNLALLTALSALVAQACGKTEAPTNGSISDRAGSSSSESGRPGNSGGSSGSGAGGGSSGSTVIDLSPLPSTGGGKGVGGSCGEPSDVLFADQSVRQIGPQRVLYSWTTDEQVAELRSGTPLFSRSERPGEGRGLLFTALASYAEIDDTPSQQLAAVLGEQIFAKARFGWPNPWATLLGFPGESYGAQLLRIELAPEAWIVEFNEYSLSVVDAEGHTVPIEDALMSPERIGAIYFESQGDTDVTFCSTFVRGGVGFREFALGNLQMVARWSLATPEIAERLRSDIAELTRFEAELECLPVPEQDWWLSNLHCQWAESYDRYGGTLASYESALGLPSELYYPRVDNVTALIAALEASMPRGEPLDVEPNE